MATRVTPPVHSRNAIIAARQKKMKCVIVVLTEKDNSQNMALEIASVTRGVESSAFKNPELKVIGVGVDWPDLVKRLRKKLGDAELRTLVEMKVGEDEGEGEGCIIL